MNDTTRKIVISAMLIAFDVIFTRLLAVNILIVKVGFGFAAVALSAMLYGPLWAGMTAALGDLLGSLIFPTGPYFPGFTATAALTGIIFGLFLYKKRPGLRQCFFAALTNGLAVTLLLNSFMIVELFVPYSRDFMLARAVEAGVMLFVQTAVLWGVSSSDVLYRRIEQYKGRQRNA